MFQVPLIEFTSKSVDVSIVSLLGIVHLVREHMLKVLVMCSGGGGNLRALLEHNNHLKLYRVIKVITDRECHSIEVAKEFGIESRIINGSNTEMYFDSIPSSIDLIVLAGYKSILPAEVCESFRGQVINIHPSLLPKFGGKNFYGVKVHQAVLAANEVITGCSIHIVTSELDSGLILKQEEIQVPFGVDAWTLGGLVHQLENRVLPEFVSGISEVPLIMD